MNFYLASESADRRQGWGRGSRRRHTARRLVHGTTDFLVSNAGAATFAAAALAARQGQRLGLIGPTWQAVRQLVPHLTEQDARDAAAESAAVRFRNHVEIATALKRGAAALKQFAEPEPPAALTRLPAGTIGVALHVGSQFGVQASFARWGRPIAALPRLLSTADARARRLKEGIDAIRAGIFVPLVLDGPGGSHSQPLTMFGREVVFRRGPLALARLTGAPVVPITGRWSAGRIVLEVGDPLPTDNATGTDLEQTLAVGAARWFEAYVARHPGQLWPFTIRCLLEAPAASAGERPRR